MATARQPAKSRLVTYGLFSASVGLFCILVFYFFKPDGPPENKWTKAKTEMGEIHKALESHARGNNNTYPESLTALKATYFPNGVPKDPFTKEDYIYEKTASGFCLICLGKDLAEGGADIPERDIIFDETGLRQP